MAVVNRSSAQCGVGCGGTWSESSSHLPVVLQHVASNIAMILPNAFGPKHVRAARFGDCGTQKPQLYREFMLLQGKKALAVPEGIQGDGATSPNAA